jgi:hypothetical protein
VGAGLSDDTRLRLVDTAVDAILASTNEAAVRSLSTILAEVRRSP